MLATRCTRRLAAAVAAVTLAIAGTGCTGNASAPGTEPTRAPGVSLTEARSAADQVVAGWVTAHETAWDPCAWDAVDAYPARLADDAAIEVSAALLADGNDQASSFTNSFRVTRVYAHSTTAEGEYLVVAGYYRDADRRAIADSDAIHLYLRQGTGAWRYAAGVGGEGVTGRTAATKGLTVSFTPLSEQPDVDVATTGANADLLDALLAAVGPQSATATVTAQGTTLTAGSQSWGGDYTEVKAAQCQVPDGPAVASFAVQEGTLSLVQLDCDIELTTSSKTLIVWTDPITSTQVTGGTAKLRVLYEALVRTDADGYTVLAHHDRWASLPTVTD